MFFLLAFKLAQIFVEAMAHGRHRRRPAKVVWVVCRHIALNQSVT